MGIEADIRSLDYSLYGHFLNEVAHIIHAESL